jgi:two-component system nitrate/nitrite sensor histidine kinase NarX
MPNGKRGSQSAMNQAGKKILRILLVEDNKDHILLCRANLTRELPGCQVDATQNGQAALAQVAQADYDIVILDHRLPDMSGLEVLAEIKSQGYEGPVVMVTGMGSEKVAVRALQEGAIDYAVKSGGWHKELPHLVRRNLEKHSLAQERARLNQEVLQRNRELAALNAIAAAVSQSLDLKEVLDAALKETLAVLNVEGGLIYLLDEISQTFTPVVHHGISQDVLQEVTGFKMGEGLSGRVAESGEALVVADIGTDPMSISPAASREGLRSYTGVPIKSKDQVLGVMTLVTRQEGHFRSDHLGLLSHIGNQIGVAIENARLYEQELSMAALAERNLMARQIHDDMAQTLSYLGLKVDYLKRLLSPGRGTKIEGELDEMRKVIDGLYDVVRQDILELRKPLPGGSDLRSSLEQVLQTFEQESGIKCELIADEAGGPDVLSIWARLQIFYIVREALANVRKHAQASEVHLTLNQEKAEIQIAVEDDGIGFDTARDNGGVKTTHLGLEIMEGRAKQIGGRLEVNSQPGCGTKIVVRIPVGA